MGPGRDTVRLLWRLARDYFQKVERLPVDARLAMVPVSDAPVSRPVPIRWNDQQVPFIEAETDEDLATAIGVVHAHLRLGQMELMRRIARGRLSELVGRRALTVDQLVRTFDLTRATAMILAMMPASTRSWLEGFARGVNHVQERAPAPRETKLLGIAREPWTAADVIALGRLISMDVNWLVWLRIFRLRQRGDWPELWRQFCTADVVSLDPRTPTADADLFAGISRMGSNSFAVAGGKSASGGALIASDPHLSITLPNAWLLAGMKSPSHHAVGMMIPGIPFMGIGRNPSIAWGGTSLHAASSDLVSVPPDTALTTREETIGVLGAPDVTLKIRESAFGPVVSDLPAFLQGPETVVLRWAGHQPSDEFTAMLRIGQARNWDEFRDALSGYAVPGLEMVFAAANGEIGRATAAKLPDRETPVPPDILRPPDNGWDRILTPNSLPSEINPRRGFVASANARLTGERPVIGYHFSPPARVNRQAALFSGAGPYSVGSMIAAQTDVRRSDALVERDAFCTWLAELGESVSGLRRLLTAWNGEYDAESRGALALEALFVCAARNLVPDDKRMAWEASWGTRLLIWRAIVEAPSDRRREALARGAIAAEKAVTHATWGDRHRLVLNHPLGIIPVLGRRYRIADLPVSGSSETLMKTAHGLTIDRHRASYGSVSRHISDLGDPDANFFALLGGQDGWIGSATFADQVELWRRREYIKIPLQPESVRDAFSRETTLRPRITQ